MPNHVTTQITGPTAILDALTRTHTEAERAAFETHPRTSGRRGSPNSAAAESSSASTLT